MQNNTVSKFQKATFRLVVLVNKYERETDPVAKLELGVKICYLSAAIDQMQGE